MAEEPRAEFAQTLEFPDHKVIKRLDVREGGKVFIFISLPPKEAGVTEDELDASYLRELWTLRDGHSDTLQGSDVFLCGPMLAGWEGTFGSWFGNRVRAAYRERFVTKRFRLMFGNVKDSSFAFLEVSHEPNENAYARVSEGRAIEL